MKVRFIANLAASALLLAATGVPAAAQAINITPLSGGGPYAATGVSYNQTIVGNQNGVFATYIQQADQNLTTATWRLVRSTNLGNSFTTVYQGVNPTTAPSSRPIATATSI
jgi:hypothetical protein